MVTGSSGGATRFSPGHSGRRGIFGQHGQQLVSFRDAEAGRDGGERPGGEQRRLDLGEGQRP